MCYPQFAGIGAISDRFLSSGCWHCTIDNADKKDTRHGGGVTDEMKNNHIMPSLSVQLLIDIYFRNLLSNFNESLDIWW